MNENDSKQLKILQNLLSDNKVLTKEVKLQLGVVEKLEKEKRIITNELESIKREAELCKERDNLNARRNAALVRENRLLKQKCEHISNEKRTMQISLQDKIVSMQASYENQLDDVGWDNERLGIDLVVKETKLKKVKKDCKLLVKKNKRIRKMRAGTEPGL